MSTFSNSDFFINIVFKLLSTNIMNKGKGRSSGNRLVSLSKELSTCKGIIYNYVLCSRILTYLWN